MRRRRFTLALAALASGIARTGFARQPGRTYRVAAMFGVGGGGFERYRAALAERLASHGFVEGRNLVLDARTAVETLHEDQALARQLLAAKPDALLTTLTRVTEAAQASTRSVPIVFVWVAEPVVSGLVKAFARPGANITGVTNRAGELLVKRLELARELVPDARRVAVVGFTGQTSLYEKISGPMREAAAKLGVEIVHESPSARGGWIAAIEAALKAGASAVLPFHVFALMRVAGSDVVRFGNEKRLPVIWMDADAVEEGGLISYGTNLVDDVRRGADMVARVLKGARPADLAVDQAARFELAVNLGAAKAQGLTIPQSILVRADRVIE